LRRCLLELAGARAPELPASAMRQMHEAVDRALARSVARFDQARSRTLEALDRISETGLGAGSLDELMQGLLRVLVETVPAADAANVFLLEGDHLALRASAGLTEARGPFSLGVGEGFAGAVAAQRRPLLVRSAATDPLVKSDFLRRHGVHALYGVPLVGAGGEVIGVVNMGSLTAHDFSETDKLLLRTLTHRAAAVLARYLLREAAESRARQLRHAESLMSVHPDQFYVIDGDQRVAWANPAMLRRWGRPLEQVVGRTLEELGYPPSLAKLHGDELDRVLAGETIQGTNAYTSPAGGSGVYEHVLAPVRAPDGRVEAVAGVTRDVSERFRAEQARADALVRERSAREEVEQTLALLDSLLAASPAGIAFIDSRMRYVRINEAMAAINGRPAKEHAGRHLREMIPGAAGVLEPMLRRVLEGGESIVNLDFQGVPPCTPGRVRSFLGNFFPVRLPGGEIFGVGCVAMEITDLKRMEEELREAVQVRERVMSILGHDLRSPLSVVTAGAAMLRRSELLGEQELRTVARITRAGDRMARMIRDLLDYARATGGGLPISRQPADLRTIARNAMDEMRAAFPGCNLELGPGGGAIEGEWDADRIAQLLANLLSNAIQYSPPGSPVELRLYGGEPERVRIEVHNRGASIRADAIPRLFEPFHRSAASDAAAPGGLGLGLFIVKQIAEGHRGSVSVRSSPQEGTTFTVWLSRR
ncbi:MAG TPA: PAS domain-containing protein, partial [Myxococcales bacterium]|nr:PAS domain-containing protein [Myxococcales bacterium]